MGRDEGACPFCELDTSRVEYESERVVVIADSYPVSPGHRLVLPKRHVQSWCDLTESEMAESLSAIGWAKQVLERELRPDGYNVGLNDGAAAGQTVPHAHIHVIPRYQGDCEDPRGGVRWVCPEKANYWDT
jgi:diadenosine tetraphosphate (Ap4A) HIT family hydrolase